MSPGTLLRLSPLHIDEIPDHEALHSPTFSSKVARSRESVGDFKRPTLWDFVEQALHEAITFVEDQIPQNFVSKTKKAAPPSSSSVELLQHSFSAQELSNLNWADSRVPRPLSGRGEKPAEHWFARKSLHPNESAEGTASFEEFDFGLRKDHSVQEMKYTPDVYDCPELLNWNEAIEDPVNQIGPLLAAADGSHAFTHIRMGIREMCHNIQRPLSPRVFPVIVLTARRADPASFIVVQIPVDIRALSSTLYSNGRNAEGSKEHWWQLRSPNKRKAVMGFYTSVEYVRLLDDATVEWIMATASDAKGRLPMCLQRLGVPGAVLKDVGFFLGYMNKGRATRRRNQIETKSVLKKPATALPIPQSNSSDGNAKEPAHPELAPEA